MKSFYELLNEMRSLSSLKRMEMDKAIKLNSPAAKQRLIQMVDQMEAEIKQLTSQRDELNKKITAIADKRNKILNKTGYGYGKELPRQKPYAQGFDPQLPTEQPTGREPMLSSNKPSAQTHLSSDRRYGLQRAEEINQALGGNKLLVSFHYKLMKSRYNEEVPVPQGITPEQATQICDLLNQGVDNDDYVDSHYHYNAQYNVIYTPGDPQDN